MIIIELIPLLQKKEIYLYILLFWFLYHRVEYSNNDFFNQNTIVNTEWFKDIQVIRQQCRPHIKITVFIKIRRETGD